MAEWVELVSVTEATLDVSYFWCMGIQYSVNSGTSSGTLSQTLNFADLWLFAHVSYKTLVSGVRQ